MLWRLASAALLVPAVLVLALGWVTSAQTDADSIELEWTVESPPEGGWTVGDRIALRLTVRFPAGIDVTIPEFPKNWGPFEVLEQSLSEVGPNADGTRSISRSAKVTAWAPGEYLTPSVFIVYESTDNQPREAMAPRLSITVTSVVQNGDRQKRDLKPQARLPQSPALPFLLGGLVLTALIGAFVWMLVPRARRRTVSSTPARPKSEVPSPSETAHTELDRIRTLDLPARGELQLHFSLVAACVRKYTQEHYGVSAMDHTTDELISALREAGVARHHADLLHELLSEADLVKFARWRPSPAEAQAVVSRARQIVDETASAGSLSEKAERSAPPDDGGQDRPNTSRLDVDEPPNAVRRSGSG